MPDESHGPMERVIKRLDEIADRTTRMESTLMAALQNHARLESATTGHDERLSALEHAHVRELASLRDGFTRELGSVKEAAVTERAARQEALSAAVRENADMRATLKLIVWIGGALGAVLSSSVAALVLQRLGAGH